MKGPSKKDRNPVKRPSKKDRNPLKMVFRTGSEALNKKPLTTIGIPTVQETSLQGASPPKVDQGKPWEHPYLFKHILGGS